MLLKSLVNPHEHLGLHVNAAGEKVVRLLRPGATIPHLKVLGETREAHASGEEGIFECVVPGSVTSLDYEIYHPNGMAAHDPYAFPPTFGEMDGYLWGRGVHYEIYRVLGARCCIHCGVQGVKVAVWAPNAVAVSLVGDFNLWDGRVNPMRSMGASGVWELFIPGLKAGEKYKFEIRTQEGHLRVKADPMALSSEMRPSNASVVAEVEGFEWGDQEWMEARGEARIGPLNIYEVHLGSWKRKEGGGFLNYRELAIDLAAYCKEMGFTHVELLPISEHPLDESWGYQVTGFFAATSRFGSPRDFQFFVNHLHREGIGVILDFVAAHFPVDGHALAQFDGSYLYEHADPKQGWHPHWDTYIFNYGRKEVSNFLIASALFWLSTMHVDGLRVDAVASMLYLDYGREEGGWIPNRWGGKENLEAIEFLKHLNAIVHEQFPTALLFAEESTSFPGVTHPLAHEGMGFDFKWNMGWMNDTLRYFHKDPLFRHHHQGELTFGLLYAFSERFTLVLSHDEVVHGKKSLLSKMPGDVWQQFASLRLLYSYLICQPGKKLFFMGGEIGQWNEWNAMRQVEWDLLRFLPHKGIQDMVKALNHFYLAHPALWQWDHRPEGFEWIDFSDTKNSVISYLRKGENAYLACVHSFTPTFCPSYFVRLPNVRSIREVFNTDAVEFGGSGKVNQGIHREKGGFVIELAPLSTMIFEVQFD